MAFQMRISVSFKPEFETEYKYLKSINNSSDFICKAVRQMIKQDSIDIEQIVTRALINFFSQYNIDNIQPTNKQIPINGITEIDLNDAVRALDW